MYLQALEDIPYAQELEEWDREVLKTLGPSATLVSVSAVSSDCRVYRTNDTIVKIRRFTPSSIRGRNNSLEDEYLIMQQLSSVTGVPAVRGYTRMKEWELLEMESLPDLVGQGPILAWLPETFTDFWGVVRVTMQMNRLGYSHGNLRRRNVGRNVEGGISVFGFEHACAASPWRCVLRDLWGLGTCERRSEYSAFNRLRSVQGIGVLLRAMVTLAKKVITLLSRTGPSPIQRARRSKSNFMQQARLQGNPSLETLAEAWSIASQSKTSKGPSYYSLDVGGVHFPGDRPWLLRWEHVGKHVDWKGKRLLELGCNMGLLSIHAKLSGAAFCLGVDREKEVLMSARLASRALGTDVEHRQIDLGHSSPWEDELKGFDIVSCLSVMHWMKDKERVWAFISKHNEVLYEGHESEQEAENNLRRAGFTYIVPLGKSDRNRQLFYATHGCEEGITS